MSARIDRAVVELADPVETMLRTLATNAGNGGLTAQREAEIRQLAPEVASSMCALTEVVFSALDAEYDDVAANHTTRVNARLREYVNARVEAVIASVKEAERTNGGAA